MTQDNWTSNGIGNWATMSDPPWSLGAPPTSGEDAFVGTNSGGLVVSGANVTVNSISVSTNYALDINSGSTFTATLGTGSNSITGTIIVADASVLEVGSNVKNFGTINIESAGDNTNFLIATNSNVTLGGGGNIEFDGQSGRFNYLAGQSGCELTNLDNDISGTGTIFGEIFTNDGIVETNNSFGAGTLSIWGNGAGGGSFDNEGSMFVDPGGTMVLGVFTSTIANDHLIEFIGTNTDAATMQIAGILTIVSVGGTISLSGPDPTNDFIRSNGSSATLNLNGGTLSGAGTVGDSNLTVNIESGTLVNADSGTLIFNTFTNTIANAGTMEATNNGLLEIDSPLNNAGGTITASGGTVSIDSAVANGSGVVSIGAGGTLELLGEGSITGNVKFAAPDARLFLDLGGSQISGNVSGAVGGDSIDFQIVQFVSGVHAVWQQSGATGTLSLVSNGSTLATLTLAGQYSTSDFSALSDGNNGTLVEVLNPPPPAGTTAAMIMRDGSNGDYEIYDLGNNAILAAGGLGQVGTEWKVAGLGAFDGTDTSDMILRNSGTGAFEMYDISNNNITNAVSIGQVGSEWAVSGFGDFSGNAGETDMLMRNSNSGKFEVYDISNNAITNAAPMGQVGTEWQVAGFGDFSGHSGETGDMLMRSSNTGQFEVYDVTNNTITFSGPMGQVGLEWQVAGFGDFSGNANETDMLMRDTNNGNFEIYDISNNTITSAAPMGQVGMEWQIAGFGPINGAGTSDMLMRNTNTGAFEIYDITNNTITNATGMGQVGLEWSVAGIAVDPPGGSSPANTQFAQAMASLGASSSVTTGNSPTLGMETSQQTLLTTAAFLNSG